MLRVDAPDVPPTRRDHPACGVTGPPLVVLIAHISRSPFATLAGTLDVIAVAPAAVPVLVTLTRLIAMCHRRRAISARKKAITASATTTAPEGVQVHARSLRRWWVEDGEQAGEVGQGEHEPAERVEQQVRSPRAARSGCGRPASR